MFASPLSVEEFRRGKVVQNDGLRFTLDDPCGTSGSSSNGLSGIYCSSEDCSSKDSTNNPGSSLSFFTLFIIHAHSNHYQVSSLRS